MMLQALIQYAERKTLGDSDFESVGIRWMLPLDINGSLVGGPIPMAENPDEKKPKPKHFFRPFTSPNDLNQGTKSHFLADTLERTVLFLDPKTAEKAPARQVQHAFFKSLLTEAISECPSATAGLSAVLLFLNNPAALSYLHQQLIQVKAKPTENATFSIDGVNLLEIEALRDFWRKRRCRIADSGPRRARRICIATGELADTLDTTDKIKGVPGGLAVGTNLISFDKDSFCSFGLEQAQNAALSAPAELKIRSALNRLIEISQSQRLVFDGRTIHLHWSRQELDFDPIDLLASADENEVAALLNSVRQGEQICGIDTNAYYAMSLSANGARVVVRDWLESTVPEVSRNVADWFSDLAIAHPDGLSTKRDFKFGALLYGMVASEIEELPPGIPTQLFYCALRGRTVPIPDSALAAALRRQQLDQDNKLNPARMALIKACLNRSLKKDSETMTEHLNPDSSNPAYLCGQLFAVFDRLQYLALGGVNAGVVDRYYASASVTPALVMGRLFRNAQFHLSKAGGGVAENVRKDFETIASSLGYSFPSTLDLEAQGRFALGYYHQKANYRKRTAERKESESQVEAQA